MDAKRASHAIRAGARGYRSRSFGKLPDVQHPGDEFRHTLPTQLTGIASGLDYLHSHGLVHGNLKQVSNHSKRTAPVWFSPCVKENILVDSTGEACLSDIGFAKLVSTGESGFGWADASAGGCRWAAPEIFQTGKLSKESDVFSYGFVAAEVRPPNRYFVSP